MKRILFGFVLILGGLISPKADADQPPVKVGVVLPLTGGAAAFGELVRKGVEASDHAGIEFVFEDEACNPTKAVNAVNKLATVDGVKFILGPVCPGGTLAIAPKLPQLDVVIMGLCTGIERGFELSKGRVFLPQYSADRDAEFNARKMYELGARRVAIIYWEQEFTLAHERSFKEHFKGQVVASVPLVTVEKSEMRAAILKLKSLDFDGIYLPIVEPFLSGFLTELNRYGLGGKKVYSIFSVEMPEVLAVEGKNAEGLIFSAPIVKTDLPLGSYYAKLGTEMLAASIRRCGNDTSCVLERLNRDYSFDHGVNNGELKLRWVHQGKFEDFPGK